MIPYLSFTIDPLTLSVYKDGRKVAGHVFPASTLEELKGMLEQDARDREERVRRFGDLGRGFSNWAHQQEELQMIRDEY